MPSRNCEKQDVPINFVRVRVHSIREVGWKGDSKRQSDDHEWEDCEALALVLRMSSMGAAARTVSMTKTPLHYVIQPQQTLITDNCITPARLLQGFDCLTNGYRVTWVGNILHEDSGISPFHWPASFRSNLLNLPSEIFAADIEHAPSSVQRWLNDWSIPSFPEKKTYP
jgi:hypothetical protein